MSLWKKEGRVRRTLWSPPEGVELQADPGEIQPFKAGGAVEGGPLSRPGPQAAHL